MYTNCHKNKKIEQFFFIKYYFVNKMLNCVVGLRFSSTMTGTVSDSDFSDIYKTNKNQTNKNFVKCKKIKTSCIHTLIIVNLHIIGMVFVCASVHFCFFLCNF